MTPETLADLYYQLAERAWERQKSRRGVELQTGIALWTAFGGGAAACITAREWTTPWWIAAPLSIAAFVVLGFYFWQWLPWLQRASKRDMDTSYFWETRLQQLLGDHQLPYYLRPEDEHDMPTVYDENAAVVGGLASSRQLRRLPEGPLFWGLHAALRMQLIVTVMFVFLFVGALWSRVLSGTAFGDGMNISAGKLRLRVEGKEGRINLNYDENGILVSPSK